ncbi:MAG: DUF2087 domain-containing protein [Atopobiaceae bacterium]|nr:DUF2087 domain-containing protein [Atopobiaceae bacterium]
MPANNSQEALTKVTEELAKLPSISEKQINLSHAVKMPFDAIPALGTAFASLPETFRTVATTVTTQSQGGEALFRLTDAAGNVITPEMLQKFKDGSGMLGSMKVDGGFVQARLHTVGAVTSTQAATAVIPFDPTTMFLAAALMQINSKLDSIASMQKEMFAYAKLCNHAKLISACNVIKEVERGYRFNSDNQHFLMTKSVAIGQAKRDAMAAISLQHDLLVPKLARLKAIHTSADVRKKTDEILELMKDYQLATYVYEYATVLDVVLAGNYSSDYLDDVIDEMERYAKQYADMYHKCLNAIRSDANKALGSRVLRGLGAASGAASNLVSSTIIGDLTPIDEAMRAGAGALYSSAKKGARRGRAAMSVAKPGFTKPFTDSIRSISRTYNEPMLIAIGSDSAYMVPVSDLLAKEHSGKANEVRKSRNRLDERNSSVASNDPDMLRAAGYSRTSNDWRHRTSQDDVQQVHAEIPKESHVTIPEPLRPYLDNSDRLKDLPKEPTARLMATWYLAAHLFGKNSYTEQELCETIDRWLLSKDHATARRELVNAGLLYRAQDGSSYSFADYLPALDRFLTSREWKRKRRH